MTTEAAETTGTPMFSAAATLDTDLSRGEFVLYPEYGAACIKPRESR